MFKLTLLRQCVQNVAKQSNIFKLNPVYLSTSATKYGYDTDIAGRSFNTFEKKYYVDIKEKDNGERYVKLSELSKGRRYTTRIDSVAAEELFDKLEGEEQYQVEGAAGWSYSVARLSNSGGTFVDIVETNPEGRRFSFKIETEDLSQLLDSFNSLKKILLKKDNPDE